MGIRALFVAFALVGGAAATAQAQTPAPAATEQVHPTDAPTAGATIMEALIYESGLVDTMLEPLIAQMMPQMRQQLLQSDLYRSVSPRAQQNLVGFFDTMPDLLRQTIRDEFTVIAQRVGVRLAQHMTSDELNGIADFMRHPSARAYLSRSAMSFASQGDSVVEPTAEELAYVEQFMTTPAGIAFMRESDYLSTVITEEFDASAPRLQPIVQSRIYGGVCDALGNECPRNLRAMAGRT
ncbi:MAG: hypothetical protein NT015_08655 [Alphaproteobacteria bacterium]|nr:hypothetical protein [Alphaproteobacteria bacterium]